MGEITETKTVKFRLPILIEAFTYALAAEDYEECSELQEYFYKAYDSFSPTLQKAFKNYLVVYMRENELDNNEDLNGLFNRLFE